MCIYKYLYAYEFKYTNKYIYIYTCCIYLYTKCTGTNDMKWLFETGEPQSMLRCTPFPPTCLVLVYSLFGT